MINDRKVNVYVFGAGASVHAGAPLGKDFFSEAFNLLCFPGGLDVDKDKFLKVASYIDELYNISLCAGLEDNNISYECLKYLPNINIEDVLTFIDIELKRNTSPESKKKLKEIQEAFYYFIFSMLEEGLKSQGSRLYRPRDNGKYDWKYDCYDKFLMNRIEKSALNVMISFNYDLLLDRALIIKNEGVLLDYLINFSDVINFPGYSERQRNIPFLKLHGSLNWAYCTQCQNWTLYYFNNYANLLKGVCSNCGNKLSPVLIPPTYFKNIEIPQLQGLWEQAHKFLRQANEITIIGYSFPDADIKAKWLFKKAIAENKNKPNLTIVNPDKIKFFLGNFFNEEPLYFDKFEDYVEH